MLINTDAELDAAIAELDQFLDADTDENDTRLNELADAIEEYEERTDILNRPSEAPPCKPPSPATPSPSPAA